MSPIRSSAATTWRGGHYPNYLPRRLIDRRGPELLGVNDQRMASCPLLQEPRSGRPIRMALAASRLLPVALGTHATPLGQLLRRIRLWHIKTTLRTTKMPHGSRAAYKMQDKYNVLGHFWLRRTKKCHRHGWGPRLIKRMSCGSYLQK